MRSFPESENGSKGGECSKERESKEMSFLSFRLSTLCVDNVCSAKCKHSVSGRPKVSQMNWPQCKLRTRLLGIGIGVILTELCLNM